MTAPNRNVLWANALVDELVAAGVDAVVASPGSRSTPLTVAAAGHEELRVFSQLDERSAAYFALGRARRTGRVTPLICTSGTAAANYHPAVMEASEARVPLLALTADRPPELRDSGANQTADQEKLYGDAVRFYKDLPEPAANDRALRSLRTTVARAVATAEGADQGPVHLNVPFKKPLEPTPVPGDVPDDLPAAAERGRDGPYVDVTAGAPEPGNDELRALATELGDADRGLIVAGPADPPGIDPESVTALAHATGFPVLADPLSGLRYGGHTRVAPVIGNYDGYLSAGLAGGGEAGGASDGNATEGDATEGDTTDAAAGWTDPDVVLRLGASPTSKRLRKYLAGTGADQYQVDPAGRWREAEFAATDLVVAEPSRLCVRLSRLVGGGADADWRAQWEEADRVAEAVHAREADAVDGEAVTQGSDAGFHEGDALRAVADALPDPATLFVSNSMPVRDLDRFVGPTTANVTALGNRGVSGIDGVVSSALGAGSGTTDDLTLVVGDLALYHDSNGLLAVDRCDVDVTVVAVNNDGGGIFHELPIESFEPPFTESFKTPHGMDFEPLADLHGLDYARIGARPDALADRGENPAERAQAAAADVADAVSRAHEEPGSHLIEVDTDAEASHRTRERLAAAVDRAVHGDAGDE
ncbi:2-succinyl-6-hydroxy-2,4-cyclohexadiene-1-carboxylate synthase [Halorubrum californiense DSM 19288]|uniref:2-succinyl-5-enolpyruvyl-6-hydroxy-3-cyclohexene-1-carboxylate synthase n=1 Tax=Halorubrum californiense DSM 19288 TaxID=1227465 RepID=M0E9X4_9EURY|nr:MULTISPECIES: 2-succinyl-5-enolpyruvyl-6-hydroxy-3-cyclohexene-1-carboxylic-acid synthase [Halorubrum]ELZ44545.1 2-succinyl-6-hydroxy-2,4-cyclohexadiene-1-carboxylate synthase [Halorubrum californiense DSM 19288]TKX72019.1 2-succinyl-5-enolpyruvyl-6-hydroxy-3-cyclohexene-1-carboxylic-acid synthase [Halorubrum sp. GN11GM_10-3_MGM]